MNGEGEAVLPLRETDRGVAEKGYVGRKAGSGTERLELGYRWRGVGAGGVLLGVKGIALGSKPRRGVDEGEGVKVRGGEGVNDACP